MTATNSQETVILLDWDDTLLCSSFLAANNLHPNSILSDLSIPADPLATAEQRQSREIAMQLRDLETCVSQVLQHSLAKAQRTIIVTNAEQGWVQLSASRFLPRVCSLLQSVTIISARSCFEHLFPDSPLKWKFYAMHSVLVGSGFFGSEGRALVDKHVISFGDSHVEREAVRALCKNIPTTRTKSVKFSERPSAEQLRRQLELVVQCFDYITGHAGDLDLQLTVTANSTNSTTPPSTTSPTTTTVDSTTSAVESLLTATESKEVPISTCGATEAQVKHDSCHHTQPMVEA